MSKRTAPYNVTKCNRRRCSRCSTIKESDCFMSTYTASVHKMNYDLSFTSTAVIYLITCKKCKAKYVGQTRQKCANRMNNHKYDIVHFPDTFINVSEHFNSAGHSIQDFLLSIDKVTNDWKRLLKETTWMHVLDTVSPNGMNSKVLLAHLSRRLIGELIVYEGIRRPSVRPSSVRPSVRLSTFSNDISSEAVRPILLIFPYSIYR